MAKSASNKTNAVVQKIEIDEIIRDQDTLQVRTEIDPKTVESYARSMKAGSVFPPVTIYRVENDLFLVDGFHRVEAAEAVAEATKKYPAMIAANVIYGDIGDAIATAAIANTTNGKQMKKKEYRTSFRMLGESGKLIGMDSRSIAELMNYVVSHVTIWKWAKEDFPGLLEAKTKKGEKPDLNQERFTDSMTKQEIEQRAAVTGIVQTHRLLFEGRVSDIKALHDIASTAKEILDKAVELGGDPENNAFVSF